MHNSVQKEWISYTKQLEVAKLCYKHFQWHSIEGAGNVLHVPLDYTDGAHTLSISCMKSVISRKASHFSSNKLYGIHKYTVFFLPYCDSLCQKLSQYGEKILP